MSCPLRESSQSSALLSPAWGDTLNVPHPCPSLPRVSRAPAAVGHPHFPPGHPHFPPRHPQFPCWNSPFPSRGSPPPAWDSLTPSPGWWSPEVAPRLSGEAEPLVPGQHGDTIPVPHTKAAPHRGICRTRRSPGNQGSLPPSPPASPRGAAVASRLFSNLFL